jgi:hypothetical protein
MELRREIHEGLNVVESWNGANDFILYGRGGEIATNRLEDQEATMLGLHLLQNCMVYVNTLMLQRVLGEPIWLERMGANERRAMTPLFWGHVNPYGTFQLDMTADCLLIRPWRQPSQANYRCTASDDPRSRATLHLVTRMLVLGQIAQRPVGGGVVGPVQVLHVADQMIGQGDAGDALGLELADTEVDGGGDLAGVRHPASVLRWQVS